MTEIEMIVMLAQACGYVCYPGEYSTIKGFVISRNREPVGFGVTEEGAWINATCNMPEWLTSVDAALSLPWDRAIVFRLALDRANGKTWHVDFYVTVTGRDMHFHAKAENLAYVLCEVFIQQWVATHAIKGHPNA